MRTSYDSPPSEWRTLSRSCSRCKTGFVVTAAEQQFWYETLKIPFYVYITDCPACRGRHRAQRRIAHRLAALMPLVDDAQVDERDLREAALIIAEGTVRRIRKRYGHEHWVLSGTPIMLKGCEIINRLRRCSRPHHDLLPLLRHFHQRLGNAERSERIAAEIVTAVQDNPVLAKATRAIEEWLKSPTKRQWERIIERPRL